MAKIIGHRGARGLAAENTLAAIKAALQYNVDEIEIDVRVTKDGVPVLNHNTFLHDPSGNAISYVRIREQTLAELQSRKTDLPTLASAIEYVNRRVPLLIEVKPRVDVAPIISLLQSFLGRGWQPHDFLLGSFSQRTLVQLHQALPDIETVVIGAVSGVRSTWRAKRLGTKRISLWHRVIWWGFVRSMNHSGYRLCAYSLNTPAKAARWAAHGLYGVITDYPDRFMKPEPSATGSTPSTRAHSSAKDS